jgi:prolipoprotein diacylglyceryltransferase
VLGRYFLLAGVFRFLLEFVRVNVRVLGPLTVAQIFALLVVVLGVVVLRRASPRAGAADARTV